MIQKCIISWFRREAGLFFFTINFIGILLFTNLFGCCLEAAIVFADEIDPEPIVVVLDPGHGGDDLGGTYEDYEEKDMNLIVARAMKEELEQYEGIQVYLTRTGDNALSLKERCAYAASVNANFLFCLHFNLSENHTLFGAETWISAFGEEYSRGYAFADIEMELLQEYGLFSRGIKTRLNDDGQDYYGIIRHSTEENMPCVLIEHCHLDREEDTPFCDSKEKLEAFGRLDAEAVARYYGLRSVSLGKDFSDYRTLSVSVPTQVMRPDSTEPDICMIEVLDQNLSNGEVTISVSAADYDSGLLYFDYSYDGGVTYSELQKWPDKTRDTFAFTITVPSGVIPQIIVNAYNGYDLSASSNMISLPSTNYKTESAPDTQTQADPSGNTQMQTDSSSDIQTQTDSLENTQTGKGIEDTVEATSGQVLSKAETDIKKSVHAQSQEQEEQPLTISYFIKICLICVAFVSAMVLSVAYSLRNYKRKKRRRRYR